MTSSTDEYMIVNWSEYSKSVEFPFTISCFCIWSTSKSPPDCVQAEESRPIAHQLYKKHTAVLPFNDPANSPTALSLMIWWGWWWHWSMLVYPDPFNHICVMQSLPPSPLPNMHWGLPCFAHWLISIHTITQQPLYASVYLSASRRLAEIDKHWHGTV